MCQIRFLCIQDFLSLKSDVLIGHELQKLYCSNNISRRTNKEQDEGGKKQYR